MFIKQGNLTNEHACLWQRGQSSDRPHRSSSHHTAIPEVIKQLLFQGNTLFKKCKALLCQNETLQEGIRNVLCLYEIPFIQFLFRMKFTTISARNPG